MTKQRHQQPCYRTPLKTSSTIKNLRSNLEFASNPFLFTATLWYIKRDKKLSSLYISIFHGFSSIAELHLQLKAFMGFLQFGAALHQSHHRPPSQANAQFVDSKIKTPHQNQKKQVRQKKSNLNGRNSQLKLFEPKNIGQSSQKPVKG